jgi:hypothetical protein
MNILFLKVGVIMAYCPHCGKKNEDDAEFCSKCGKQLTGSTKKHEDEWEKRCEEECAGGKGGRHWSIFWGLVIILVGLWIIFEIVLKELAKTYSSLSWVNDISFPFWWIIMGVIALLIIVAGIRIIVKSR